MFRLFPVLIVVISLGFAPAPFLVPSPGSAADLKALEGEWELKPGYTMTIKGDCWTDSFRGEVRVRWRVTYGPPGFPRAIDLQNLGGTGFVDRCSCIYRLRGDTLTLATSTSVRPSNFDGSQAILVVFKRKRR
jgi:uncharacterized protein (TIGR03067 family)